MEFKTMNEGKKMRSQFFEVIQIRYLLVVNYVKLNSFCLHFKLTKEVFYVSI